MADLRRKGHAVLDVVRLSLRGLGDWDFWKIRISIQEMQPDGESEVNDKIGSASNMRNM